MRGPLEQSDGWVVQGLGSCGEDLGSDPRKVGAWSSTGTIWQPWAGQTRVPLVQEGGGEGGGKDGGLNKMHGLETVLWPLAMGSPRRLWGQREVQWVPCKLPRPTPGVL